MERAILTGHISEKSFSHCSIDSWCPIFGPSLSDMLFGTRDCVLLQIIPPTWIPPFWAYEVLNQRTYFSPFRHNSSAVSQHTVLVLVSNHVIHRCDRPQRCQQLSRVLLTWWPLEVSLLTTLHLLLLHLDFASFLTPLKDLFLREQRWFSETLCLLLWLLFFLSLEGEQCRVLPWSLQDKLYIFLVYFTFPTLHLHFHWKERFRQYSIFSVSCLPTFPHFII